MALEKELETYRKMLPTLLQDQGKFVVICGEEVLGTFVDYGDALSAGYKKYGLKPFLVKKIEEVETPQRFTRDFPLCRT